MAPKLSSNTFKKKKKERNPVCFLLEGRVSMRFISWLLWAWLAWSMHWAHTYTPQFGFAQPLPPSLSWQFLSLQPIWLCTSPSITASASWESGAGDGTGDSHKGSGIPDPPSLGPQTSLAATWFIKRALWLWKLTSFWIANRRGGNCTLWKDWLNTN